MEDDRDLERTVEELAPALLRFCLAVASDRSLAEEAAQEALTALVTRWRRQGPPHSAEAFVFTIARRRARRHLWRRRLLSPLEALPFAVARSPEPDPETLANDKNRLERTRLAIAALPTKDREALALAVDGDLTVAQAAGILGLSPSAFKMRVHRARRRLKAALDSQPQPNPPHLVEEKP